MSRYHRVPLILFSSLISMFLIIAMLFSAAQASELQADGVDRIDEKSGMSEREAKAEPSIVDPWMVSRVHDQKPDLIRSMAFAPGPTTTLSVAIISTKYAPLDNNHLDTGPNVFVVEAVVRNTGAFSATDVLLELDFNEDPGNNWKLLPGEDPLRSGGTLAPDEQYFAYWFATYPKTINAAYQYTVTAYSGNAASVSTSDNFFGNPTGDQTVMVRSFQDTGSNGQTSASSDVVVGVSFSVSVEYAWNQSANKLIFSPVGNPSFDPSAARLLSSTVSLQNATGSQRIDYENKLYFDTVPLLPNGNAPEKAVTTYKFLALKPSDTTLCAYTAIDYVTTRKYDKNFCTAGTAIHIGGTSSVTLTKLVSSLTVKQGELLTYTLNYANEGDMALQYVWIWDEIDPAIGQVVASTLDPAPNQPASNEDRVAWYFDRLPASGQPGSSGTMTVTVLVDGDGNDLNDGDPVVNQAFFGVNPISLPSVRALTDTVTSTLLAPQVTIEKSDGMAEISPGETVTYTITATNDGSIAATGLVITDILPFGVSLAGIPSPPPDYSNGSTLEWYAASVGNLLAGGNPLTITIPAIVGEDVAIGSQLTNTASIQFQNDIGHTYTPIVTTDVTTVIKKAGFVDGYAFEDLDGNGIFDAGESGLENVTIQLPTAVTPTTTTDANGYFQFRIESEGRVTATSTLPAGYFRTTPETVFADVSFGESDSVAFGFAPNDAGFGVVYGTIFDDADSNGIRDLIEDGLSGVNITSAEAEIPSILSNPNGNYTLRFNNAGTVTITETNPLGYVSTTPDMLVVNVLTGSDNNSPFDFGDFQGIKITGMVFEDENVNGKNDGEDGLSGAEVEAGSLNFTTGPSGVYTFYLDAGTVPITVTETDPDGYTSTNAVPGPATSKVDANSLLVNNPVAGNVYGGDFGDTLPSDLSIVKSSELAQIAAGNTLTYTIVYTNQGPAPARTIAISDTLPVGAVFKEIISQPTNMDGPSQDGRWLVWTKDEVANDEMGIIVFIVTVSPSLAANTVLSNRVAITSATPDLVQGNNSSTAETQVVQIADLLISKNVVPSPVVAGTILTYTLEVTNQGPSDASEVIVTDVLSDVLKILNSQTTMGAYDPATGLWEVGDLPLDSSASLTLELNLDPSATGTLVNTATVTADSSDPDPENNEAMVETTILASADLAIFKTAEPSPVAAGGVLTYTVVYTNYGPSDAQDVLITDTLGADLTFGGIVDEVPPLTGPSLDGQTLTWEAGTIAAGDSGMIIFTATVHPAAQIVVTNHVEIASTTPDLVQQNDEDSEETPVGYPGFATIYGYVFDDLDGNGLRDDGEPGISGVRITLDGTDLETTNADGLYVFLIDKPGPHSVTESQPGGYFSTTPNEVHLTTALGASYRVDFGDADDESGFASIYGTVFNDANSNETWDEGENGLKAVTVTLDGTTVVKTDLYGRFTFSTAVDGSHVVVETDPDFYFSTTPNTVNVDVDLNYGYEINFGDVPADIAKCPADTYEEDDNPNQAKALPFGHSFGHDFCDDATDWHKINVQGGRTYTITTSAWDRRVDTYLALYDKDGKTILAANDDYKNVTDYSSQLVWKASRTGVFYVRITNRAGLEGRHTKYEVMAEEKPLNFVYLPLLHKSNGGKSTLSMFYEFGTFASQPSSILNPDWLLGEINHSCPDSYEIDDTWQVASELISNTPQEHTFDSNPSLYAADKDFMWFDLASGQWISLTVTSASTSALLEVYDDAGHALGLSGIDFLYVDGIPAGHYYLSVTPTNTNYGCLVSYQLLAEKEELYANHIPLIFK